MGLFGKKANCSICGNEKKVKALADGFVCQECMDKCGNSLLTLSWKTVMVQRVRDAISDEKKNKEHQSRFQETRVVGKELIIDENHRLWRTKAFGNCYFSYDDIIDYECVKNGKSVHKVGVGRAIIGGAIFGEVGAVLGGFSGSRETEEINEFRIVINTSNKSYPEISINLLQAGKINGDSLAFKTLNRTAEEIIKVLDEIGGQIVQEPKVFTKESSPDEIMKYKSLLDAGAITQEEYDAKKKQLLGL